MELLRAKDNRFVVIDTHAGAGVHDLGSKMALRTGEADFGIRRVAVNDAPALGSYLDVVRASGGGTNSHYPGSPEIARRLLRAQDRLIACELHPEDVLDLRANLGGDGRVTVHHRDGYEALLALLPPPERRGLVFIDPPFERPGEAEQLADHLVRAVRKWGTGVFAAWYPVKNRKVENTLRAMVARSRAKDVMIASFLALPYDGRRLSGGGLFVINPPWRLDERLDAICKALARSYDQSSWSMEWLARDYKVVSEPVHQ